MKPFNKEKCAEREVNVGDIIMHGDLIIEKIKELPGRFLTLDKEPNNALAYGEQTGHIHQLSEGKFDIRIDNENHNNRYLRLLEPISLKHQEHKEIILPPGNYRSRIQKEYDPFTKKIREVAD